MNHVIELSPLERELLEKARNYMWLDYPKSMVIAATVETDSPSTAFALIVLSHDITVQLDSLERKGKPGEVLAWIPSK